jgi:hypothetical protein
MRYELNDYECRHQGAPVADGLGYAVSLVTSLGRQITAV